MLAFSATEVGALQVVPPSRVCITVSDVFALFKNATVIWPGLVGSAATSGPPPPRPPPGEFDEFGTTNCDQVEPSFAVVSSNMHADWPLQVVAFVDRAPVTNTPFAADRYGPEPAGRGSGDVQ
jgi:hypothetical protein